MSQKNRFSTRSLTISGMIAAVYAALTLALPVLSYGASSGWEMRISEALTILPILLPEAVPGLTVGCLIANTLGGAALPDIVFGSLATLAGAYFSYRLRRSRWLVPIPAILANAVVLPFVLKYAYAVDLPIPFMMLTVGIGEVVSCGIFGLVLYYALNGRRAQVFGEAE